MLKPHIQLSIGQPERMPCVQSGRINQDKLLEIKLHVFLQILFGFSYSN